MIAEKLGMSISEAKSKITATEFLGWVEKINQDLDTKWDKHEKWEYYLAQSTHRLDAILHVVSNLFSKNPSKFEALAEQFLLKFTTDVDSQKKPVPAEKEIVAWSRDGFPMTADDVRRVNESKRSWLTAVGAKKKEKRVKRGEEVTGVPTPEKQNKIKKPKKLPPHVAAATAAYLERMKKLKADKK